MFDWPWSGIHFTSGLLIGLALAILVDRRYPKRFWFIGLGLLVLWELVEVTLRLLDTHAHEFIAPLKQSVAGFAFGAESIVNTTGDMIIGALGLLIALFFVRKFFLWRRREPAYR